MELEVFSRLGSLVDLGKLKAMELYTEIVHNR